MAILEAEEFIKMIQLLSSTGAMDPEKTNKLLVDFMDVIGKKLGVDIKSAMKSDFTINTATQEKE